MRDRACGSARCSLGRAALAAPGQSDGFGRALDPSYPEVLDWSARTCSRFKDWGFELVKHDFSTYDVFGRFGPAMGARLTDDGWQFHDPTRTTAEIILASTGRSARPRKTSY